MDYKVQQLVEDLIKELVEEIRETVHARDKAILIQSLSQLIKTVNDQ